MTSQRHLLSHSSSIDEEIDLDIFDPGEVFLASPFTRRCLLFRTTGYKSICPIFSLWERRISDDPAHNRKDWEFLRPRWKRTVYSTSSRSESPRSPLYQYEKLTVRCIRLLQIKAGRVGAELQTALVAVSLDTAASFETLSYTWAGARARYVRCSQHSIRVSENLFQALHALRSEAEERTFWIDAICINQDDLEEKKTQVEMMRDIYATSQRTIVWLGSVTGLQPATSQLIKDLIYLGHNPGAAMEFGTDENIWHQLGELFRDPWFTRMWIIQEVAVSRQVVVLTESGSWSWEELVSAAISARDYAKEFQILFDPDNAIRLSEIRQMYAQRQLPDMLRTLLLTRRSASTMSSDKIYAALGLTDAHFSVDYKETATQTFVRLAVNVILNSRQRLMLLNVVNDHVYSLNRELPSWVPDWEVRHGPKSFTSWPVFSTWQASGRSEPTLSLSNEKRTLHVRGFILDRVKHVGRAYREVVPLSGAAPRLKQSFQRSRGTQRYLMGEYMIRQASMRSVQWYDLALKHGFQYGGVRARFHAYLLTLIASSGPQSATDESMSDLEDGFRAWHSMSTSAMTGDFNVIVENFTATEETAKRKAMRFITQNVNFAWGRRFFTTKVMGLMGLCPSLVRRGDLVVILHGGSTPYVIRRIKNGRYQFIGECYVHGFMYGEAMEKEEAMEIQDFELV